MSAASGWTRLPWAGALLGVIAGCPSCNDHGPLRLKDTEGRSFEAKCEKSGCALTPVTDRAEGEKRHAKLEHTGRLVGVCDVESPDQEPHDWDCRALECAGAEECPPLYGLDQGQCLNGLCIDPAHPLGPSDAVMLCLAGTGLGRTAPKQVERYALALNCGKPCRIPQPCRQP